MNCPNCRARDSKVLRTIYSHPQVIRQRTCLCGATWETHEKLLKGTVQVVIGVPRRRVTSALREQVFARDGNKCRYCGGTEKLGIDHITPISAPIPPGVSRLEETERRNGLANLCVACRRCNCAKADKPNQQPPDLDTGSNRQPPVIASIAPIPSSAPASDGVSGSSLHLSDHPERAGSNGNATGKFWTGWQWRQAFARAWCDHYSRISYGGGDADARATGDISDQLGALAEVERLGAQHRAPAMFAEFLSDESSATVKARHPWSWFVQRFQGLIVPQRAPAKVASAYREL